MLLHSSIEFFKFWRFEHKARNKTGKTKDGKDGREVLSMEGLGVLSTFQLV